MTENRGKDMKISWSPIAQQSNIATYKLELVDQHTSASKSATVGGSTHSYTFSGLTGNSNYKIKLTACASENVAFTGGCDEESAPIAVTTDFLGTLRLLTTASLSGFESPCNKYIYFMACVAHTGYMEMIFCQTL